MQTTFMLLEQRQDEIRPRIEIENILWENLCPYDAGRFVVAYSVSAPMYSTSFKR